MEEIITGLLLKMKYTPIDYLNWDFNGKGNNIIKMMNSNERQIWRKSFPYQDKRNDTGHAEIVTYFAFKFLDIISADRKIVIPAAIFHDAGYNINGDEFRKLCGTEREREIRLEHQVRGVLIANEILNQVKYPVKSALEIMRIISNHDTKISDHKGLIFNLTKEERIIRDADILWRFTKPCMISYNFGKPKEEIRTIMEKEFSKDNIYNKEAKKIAKIEIENTLSSI